MMYVLGCTYSRYVACKIKHDTLSLLKSPHGNRFALLDTEYCASFQIASEPVQVLPQRSNRNKQRAGKPVVTMSSIIFLPLQALLIAIDLLVSHRKALQNLPRYLSSPFAVLLFCLLWIAKPTVLSACCLLLLLLLLFLFLLFV